VDLVGSTALAQELSIEEWGKVMTTFETVAADTVNARGGRVVKLIGDEILFTAADAAAAYGIARGLVRVLAEQPKVPPVRTGLAAGRVLLRDGDVFGPVVALAARAVKVAGPGEIVASVDVAAAVGGDAGVTANVTAQPLAPQALKGFAGDVELFRLPAE
jgi:adenylate cyclase